MNRQQLNAIFEAAHTDETCKELSKQSAQATSSEVTRVISQSAIGVKQIYENIAQVSKPAKNVGDTADQLKKYVAQLQS
jgi:hypothetical protein